MSKQVYIAIDLKSFYASVECVERNLDPLTTNLVVADGSKTEKTICLALSPSLKQYGLPGRARLFEVIQKVKEVNIKRQRQIKGRCFQGESYNDDELKNNPYLKLSYIIATPRMAFYLEYSAEIYKIYLKYVSPEDIHVYSIDEVFIDATHYLKNLDIHPKDFAKMIIQDIYNTFKITATAGIGTNLYLCKVAMDIVAKHIKPDQDGVRIASLNEKMYRKYLWNHQPITDFWRVGRGYKQKLQEVGLYTMGDIAKCSVGKADDYYNEELLYDMFGVNAELLIDHAWGKEPTTIAQIKKYQPENNSISHSQVLFEDYSYEDALLAMKEMVELKVLDLVEQHLVTRHIALYVGYSNKKIKATGGSLKIGVCTNSYRILLSEFITLYKRTTHLNCPIRRLGISFGGVIDEKYEAYDLFTDYQEIEKERKLQEALINIKGRYGKNAVFKGMDLLEKATTLKRNKLIGGHNGE